MERDDLERLSKPALIDLVLTLQRPAKTSRTSSKPPSTDRKERRAQSRPGGAKPGHEGHKRRLTADPDVGGLPVGRHSCVTDPSSRPATRRGTRGATGRA